MMIISFFTSKKSGASNTKALVTAGLAGAATYGVTHYTDWGKANLGDFDGVIPAGTTPVATSTGGTMTDVTGQLIKAGSSVAGSTADVLKSWGANGTAVVLGTAAAAGSGLFSDMKKYMPWLLLIGGIWAVSRS